MKVKTSLSFVVTVWMAVAIAVSMLGYAVVEQQTMPGASLRELLVEHLWHVLGLGAVIYLMCWAVFYFVLLRPVNRIYLHLYSIGAGQREPLQLDSNVREIRTIVDGVNLMLARFKQSANAQALELAQSRLAEIRRMTHHLAATDQEHTQLLLEKLADVESAIPNIVSNAPAATDECEQEPSRCCHAVATREANRPRPLSFPLIVGSIFTAAALQCVDAAGFASDEAAFATRDEATNSTTALRINTGKGASGTNSDSASAGDKLLVRESLKDVNLFPLANSLRDESTVRNERLASVERAFTVSNASSGTNADGAGISYSSAAKGLMLFDARDQRTALLNLHSGLRSREPGQRFEFGLRWSDVLRRDAEFVEPASIRPAPEWPAPPPTKPPEIDPRPGLRLFNWSW